MPKGKADFGGGIVLREPLWPETLPVDASDQERPREIRRVIRARFNAARGPRWRPSSHQQQAAWAAKISEALELFLAQAGSQPEPTATELLKEAGGEKILETAQLAMAGAAEVPYRVQRLRGLSPLKALGVLITEPQAKPPLSRRARHWQLRLLQWIDITMRPEPHCWDGLRIWEVGRRLRRYNSGRHPSKNIWRAIQRISEVQLDAKRLPHRAPAGGFALQQFANEVVPIFEKWTGYSALPPEHIYAAKPSDDAVPIDVQRVDHALYKVISDLLAELQAGSPTPQQFSDLSSIYAFELAVREARKTEKERNKIRRKRCARRK